MAVADDDGRFMAKAIALSRTHIGQTSTNPSVGCVIVSHGAIVGEGVTAIGGRPHAEPQALAQAKDRAAGATAYVTLEPCSHFGRTPPCADALIAAGIARVVIAVTDPDTRVSGRGIGMLRDAGIEVETGVMEPEARRALAGYLMRQIRGRPYVTLKLAVSADGMIGRKGAGQVRITGDAARREVHELRAESDAILIGIGTALADDPDLTCRIPGKEDRSPLRIVLDRRLDISPRSKLALSARVVPVVVVTDEGVAKSGSDIPPGHGTVARDARLLALSQAGVEVLEAHDPQALLFALGSRGISTLLVEGGAGVARAFLDAGVVDRIILYTGPEPVGDGGLESPLTGADIPNGFSRVESRKVGRDRCDMFEREF